MILGCNHGLLLVPIMALNTRWSKCNKSSVSILLYCQRRIKNYASLVEKISGSRVSYGLVQYSDDPRERSLTVKDAKLSYQKEFRFFTGRCSKEELQDRYLDLPDLNEMLLDAQSLKLTSPDGITKYCSVGYKGTVTVEP